MRFLCQRFTIATSQRHAAKLLIPFALLLIILAILSTLPANWPLWQLAGGQLLAAAIIAPLFWRQANDTEIIHDNSPTEPPSPYCH